MIPWNLLKLVSTNHSRLRYQTLPAHFNTKMLLDCLVKCKICNSIFSRRVQNISVSVLSLLMALIQVSVWTRDFGEYITKTCMAFCHTRWTELARRWVTWRIRPIRFNFVCLPAAGKFQLQQLDHCLHFPWILHWISRRSQVPMTQRAKEICLEPFT